jgi:hypothetical protein
MKYTQELIDIIRNKEFKTFWHCLDYLILGGYSPIDAFGITIQEFGENKIYSNVAFLKIDERINILDYPIMSPPKSKILIGLIDETNIHLSGLYDTYRKWLSEGKLPNQIDIEETCENLEIDSLPIIIIEYLHEVSEKHFGYSLFRTKNPSPHRKPLESFIEDRLYGKK